MAFNTGRKGKSTVNRSRGSSSRTASETLAKLRTDIWRYRQILKSGSVLSIDPSAVSTSSLPGYALVSSGKLVEAGVLDISTQGPLHLRLQKIHNSILEFFPTVDLLIIEEVAVRPLRSRSDAKMSGKTYMNPRTIHSLAQAVGVFKGSVQVGTPVLQVSPLTWTSYKRRYNWDLDKGDYEDAIAMWLTVKSILTELEIKLN